MGRLEIAFILYSWWLYFRSGGIAFPCFRRCGWVGRVLIQSTRHLHRYCLAYSTVVRCERSGERVVFVYNVASCVPMARLVSSWLTASSMFLNQKLDVGDVAYGEYRGG
ncbi:hypothetical protein B0H67DRAFT_201295 [Lasiosphaeris hirsuta]|uniref:Uncharacterized protein n=1 Tax=Lasiosphaeris hirsuta TaxID=260670 RepID=A0AA40ARQ9_9PEZI|nr:hypothetical protein B0H67DRAFT_201295 [Lasiosphaeris hirsuta]